MSVTASPSRLLRSTRVTVERRRCFQQPREKSAAEGRPAAVQPVVETGGFVADVVMSVRVSAGRTVGIEPLLRQRKDPGPLRRYKSVPRLVAPVVEVEPHFAEAQPIALDSVGRPEQSDSVVSKVSAASPAVANAG